MVLIRKKQTDESVVWKSVIATAWQSKRSTFFHSHLSLCPLLTFLGWPWPFTSSFLCLLQVILVKFLLTVTVCGGGHTTPQVHILSVGVIIPREEGKWSESLCEKKILTPKRARAEMRTSRCLHGYMESVNLAWNVSFKKLERASCLCWKPFEDFLFFFGDHSI